MDLSSYLSWAGIFEGLLADIVNPIASYIITLLVNDILRSILCQIYLQQFYIYNAGIVSTKPGLFNNALAKLYANLKDKTSIPLQTVAKESTQEDVTVPNIFIAKGYIWPGAPCAATSYCPYPPAINFNTSGVVKGVSLVRFCLTQKKHSSKPPTKD